MGVEGIWVWTVVLRTDWGRLSSMTDQNREEDRNAISFELIMNHTALAIICLHIIGLVMCWWEISFHCLVQMYFKSNFI